MNYFFKLSHFSLPQINSGNYQKSYQKNFFFFLLYWNGKKKYLAKDTGQTQDQKAYIQLILKNLYSALYCHTAYADDDAFYI